MKNRNLMLVIVLMLTATSALLAQASENSEASIKMAVERYDAAWNKKDSTAVANLLADDYVYFSSTGGLTDRKSTLTFLDSPDYKLTFVERSEIKLLSRTDTVAVVSSRWKGRGTYGKEEINDDQRCGLVFVKQAKRWMLLSEHCAQIVSK